jgi:hypothetical protein
VFIVRSRFYRMLTLAIAAETLFGAQVKQDIADVEHSSSKVMH